MNAGFEQGQARIAAGLIRRSLQQAQRGIGVCSELPDKQRMRRDGPCIVRFRLIPEPGRLAARLGVEAPEGGGIIVFTLGETRRRHGKAKQEQRRKRTRERMS